MVSENIPSDAPVDSFTNVTATCFGFTSGTASGSEPARIVAFLSCTRARAWMDGTIFGAPGTIQSLSDPKM